MKFEDIDPVARHNAEMERIKAELRRAADEIDTTRNLWLVASGLTRLCADLQEAVARYEWREGYMQGARMPSPHRIGSGVTVTANEVQ